MMDFTFEEICYWNSRSYGTGLRVPRAVLRGIVAVLCLATPGTNWMVPLAFRWIRRDMMIRYER